METENRIEKSTVIRTAVLFVALINTLLNAFGYKTLPFTDDQVSMIVAAAFDIAASLWAWWKNNSFTKSAIKADKQMKLDKEKFKE